MMFAKSLEHALRQLLHQMRTSKEVRNDSKADFRIMILITMML